MAGNRVFLGKCVTPRIWMPGELHRSHSFFQLGVNVPVGSIEIGDLFSVAVDDGGCE